MTLDQLKTYCDDGIRLPRFAHPWNYHGHTYASDGSIVVRVPQCMVAAAELRHAMALKRPRCSRGCLGMIEANTRRCALRKWNELKRKQKGA